jgi:XTP/dITP diphosphohydrolase
MVSLIIATRNPHKVGEIGAMLGPDFKCSSLRDLQNSPAVVEDATTFAGNATKKAVAIARWLSGKRITEVCERVYVLADDSGLEVDALGGAPGVNSARFAALDSGGAGNSPDDENNRKLLWWLQNVSADNRTGRFRCVLALCPLIPSSNPCSSSPVCAADEWEMSTELFEGVCEGRIAESPSGSRGFGYDPLFIPVGYQQSFAELGEDIKNTMSHRSKALARLKARFARAAN